MDENFRNDQMNQNGGSGDFWQTQEQPGTSYTGQQTYTPNQQGWGDQSQTYYNNSYYTYDRAAQKRAKKMAKKQAKAEARARYKESRKGSFGTTIGKCAVIALVFGLVAGSAFSGVVYFSGAGSKVEQAGDTTGGQDNAIPAQQPQEQASTAESASNIAKTDTFKTGNVSGLPDVSDIVEETMPSIVAITNLTTVTGMTWFGQPVSSEEEYAGSGVIVASDETYLYIATNNHVVAGANSLTVQFGNDDTAAAEVKGTSESNDLAVIEVKLADLEEETLANAIKIANINDSGDYPVGSGAIAIGNALGYGQSVTVGYISAVDREVTIQDETTGTYFTSLLIQTDAAINPGNSGGALLNSAGEVIGINSSKYADTSVEGMGFAIPMSTAMPIIDNIINRQEVDVDEAAYIGIQGVDVDSSAASTYGLPTGVFIYKIYRNSPAAASDLLRGDIITAIDGNKVGSMAEIQELLRYYSAGTDVVITVYRANAGVYETVDVPVTLGRQEAQPTD